jgi:pimeloyl-ACP methyl ester carboxylesterase
MTMETLHFTSKDNIRLAADSFGNGRPVVLLHGGGQTRGAWHHTAKSLADRGYRAIALDLRGHGESDWSKSGYSFDTFTDDLHSVISDVGGRPALIGASLGGMTAMLAIGEANTPIASALVLVDIATQINPEGGKAIHAFMTANPDGFDSVEDAADAVSRYLPHRPRPKDISGLRRNLREGKNGRLFWHWDPSLFNHDAAPDPTVAMARIETAAASIKVPTLLVRGGRSEIVTPEGVSRFRQILPTAEVAEVPEAGHMVAGDANSAFADSVLDFLGRVYPA